jgi:hypothetical protein
MRSLLDNATGLWGLLFSICLLLLILVTAVTSAILMIHRPSGGRFLPLSGNPYLLLDTATGTECLRVQKNRAAEMTTWLLYAEKDKDVQDSYQAALLGYTGLKDQYAKDFENAHRLPEVKLPEVKHQGVQGALIDQWIDEVQKRPNLTTESEKAATEQSQNEFATLTKLFHSVDQIPVCSEK